MSYSWGEIKAIVERRRQADSPLKRQMIEIRDRYNGDFVIPLPSVEDKPEMEPPVPRLVADGIDHTAMNASSMRPVINVPAVDPAKPRGVRSKEYASIRRRFLYATWHKSQMDLLIRRAYRQLVGYGELAYVVQPDFNNDIPRIELRDALTAYPETRTPEDVRRPNNVAFVFGRTADWLKRQFGPAAGEVVDGRGRRRGDDIWDVVEWIDDEEIVIGILGPRLPPYRTGPDYPNAGQFTRELRRWPNRAGICTGVSSRRVTLDKIAGQLSHVVPTIDLMGKMMALDVLAAEKAIFPDRFVIGREGRPPQVLGGKWKDGRTGETNILTDVEQLGELQSSPGPLTNPIIDRLREAAQFSGGVVPQFGGLTTGSLRTGRSLDAMAGMAISPRIAEVQEIMARALIFVNEATMATMKGYWPSKEVRLFSGWSTDYGHVELVPEQHIESLENTVSYDFPGSDPNAAAVSIAQLVGAGMMSKHTGMTRHPFIEDPELEYNLRRDEQVDDALIAGLQQAAVSGEMPIIDLARVKELIREGRTTEEAIIQADREARERQVREAPAPGEGEVAAPEEAPGLAPPGMGAEQPPQRQGTPGIGPPEQATENFRRLAMALRGGQANV